MRTKPRTVSALVCSLVVVAASLIFCGRDAGPAHDALTFHDRAERVAAAWEASAAATTARQGLTLLSTTTWMPYADSPWPSLDDFTSVALHGQHFKIDSPLPPAPAPATGTVTFAVGGTLSVPLETAEQAYQEFAAPCPAGDPRCPVVGITGAELITRHVLTGRGEADVPVWRFAVAGIDQPVDQVAVAPSARRPIPAGPALLADSAHWNDTMSGYGSVDAVTSAVGTDVEFVTVPNSCFSYLGPLVYEDQRVVVLGARMVPYRGQCSLNWMAYRVTATLPAPIGNRVVLDVVTGGLVL